VTSNGRHPELDAEQAYIDHAYACLDAQRERVTRLRSMVEVGRGGTNQARWEREVFEGNINHRLGQLQLGSASLVFGRIDDREGAAYHIGRLAVAAEDQEPVVVDWRAPVAEPFYRATGREPMGLRRRRHFATRGRELLDIEDEVFALEGLASGAIRGHGALLTALEQHRTGQLTDIVATIQGEQDEIIRDELKGILVVQGGPGTGKTVVALHRAAYLLYTYRFPLEGQGVLVVAPNRLFLRYVEQVLPSLGEAGVHLMVLADLLEDLLGDIPVRLDEGPRASALKGDARMADLVANAVADRERTLREDLAVPFGLVGLRLTVQASRHLVREARRRARTHNAARRFFEAEFFRLLAASHRSRPDPGTVRARLRGDDRVRAALEWMWPQLTPAQLLRDLFGSRALLASAARGRFDPTELEQLYRSRGNSAGGYEWSDADVPLLDEAYARLGARQGRRHDEPELRTYGHIIVDEAQDHSAMALRMIARRSLNGSMTVVGDIAQATSAAGAHHWQDVLGWLPHGSQPPRQRELTLGYRIPAPNMGLAARVLAEAEPTLEPPRSVRTDGSAPRIVGAAPEDLAAQVVAVSLEERAATGGGSVAVILPRSLIDSVEAGFVAAGVDHGRATIASRNVTGGLWPDITLIPIPLAKGLEFDVSVVVEPARIVSEEPRGLHALYVAVTRATKRLALVHAEALPTVLAE
jgi:DNA helicase IV